jgi:hypothetical protein
MAEPIQIAPQGLLNYFGIQNGGRNPSGLANDLTGVLDLQPLYDIEKYEAMSDGVAAAAGGALGDFAFSGPTNLPGVCPANEFWHILRYNVFISVATVGATMSVTPTVQVPRKGLTGGGSFALPVGPMVNNPQVGPFILQAWATHDFWVPPGGVLGGTTNSLTPIATAVQAFGQVFMVRYRR